MQILNLHLALCRSSEACPAAFAWGQTSQANRFVPCAYAGVAANLPVALAPGAATPALGLLATHNGLFMKQYSPFSVAPCF